MTSTPPAADAPQGGAASAYEPPALVVVGSVHRLTLQHCWWGKKWGGVDGIEFMNISIPVSSC